MTTCHSLTTTVATVLHSQSNSRMSLYLSLSDKLSLMTSSIKWAMGGGGAQKTMCAHPRINHKRKAQSLLRQGSMALLSSEWFWCSLLCYLSLIFKHSDTKWDNKKIYKKTPVGPNLGGSSRLLRPHCMDPPLNIAISFNDYWQQRIHCHFSLNIVCSNCGLTVTASASFKKLSTLTVLINFHNLTSKKHCVQLLIEF